MREPNVGIASAITAAARLTGVSASYLTATAARESAFDAEAKAATSSASGLFQFIDSTWLSTLERHGESLGLGDAASLGREEALALRFDPGLSALLAGALTADNAAVLESRLGRPAADGELYAAHVLGAGGAADLIHAAGRDPNRPAAELFPAAARANRGLFYGADGEAVSVASLAAKFDSLMQGRAAAPASDPVSQSSAPPRDPAVVDSASLSIRHLSSPAPATPPPATPPPATPPLSRAALMRGATPLYLSPSTIELLAALQAPERADTDKS